MQPYAGVAGKCFPDSNFYIYGLCHGKVLSSTLHAFRVMTVARFCPSSSIQAGGYYRHEERKADANVKRTDINASFIRSGILPRVERVIPTWTTNPPSRFVTVQHAYRDYSISLSRRDALEL